MSDYVQITCRAAPELARRLDEAAAYCGLDRSATMRALIEHGLAAMEARDRLPALRGGDEREVRA